jgi:predicted kinase
MLASAGDERVVVLVGTSGSGKTTLRRSLVATGLPADRVVSLDDLRREARHDDLARGRPAHPLQHYSPSAARRALRRTEVMAALGVGYVADATHLLRRDRRVHVLLAAEAGLPAIAVLTPLLPIEELVARNSGRPADEQVPDDVLVRQRHRRSLLSAELLLEEGFIEVQEPV